MGSFTARVGIYQPDSTEDVDVEAHINQSFDKVEGGLGYFHCTAASRPSTNNFEGRLIFETDTKKVYQYLNGVWQFVGLGVHYPTLAAYYNADQSIPNGVFTRCNLNTLVHGSSGMWNAGDNSRINIPITGAYEVTIHTTFRASGANNSRRISQGYVNGGANSPQTVINGSVNGNDVTSVNTFVRTIAAGNYFEAFAFQDSGGALNIRTEVSIRMVYPT